MGITFWLYEGGPGNNNNQELTEFCKSILENNTQI